MRLNSAPAQTLTRVTITDVASALGLTKGTVSRALNNYPDISDNTRQRVRRMADQMGYRPLAQAQAIRTGRSRALGLVLQTDVAGAQRPFLSDFLAGVTQTASSESWTLTVATSSGGAEMRHTIERLVEERKADGFIVPRTFARDDRVDLLRSMGVPYVLYGRLRDIKNSAWFDILGEDAMKDAVLRLSGLGHRRIAFVNGGTEYNFSHLREGGFRAGLEACGLKEDEELFLAGAMTQAAGEQAVYQLMSLPRPPTAIVFAVDMAALGAYRAAKALQLAIGADLSLISYDGIPECEWVHPPLTSFRVDSHHAGGRLADLLIRQIRGEPPISLRETASAILQPGGSDGPPTKSSDALAEYLAVQRQEEHAT